MRFRLPRLIKIRSKNATAYAKRSQTITFDKNVLIEMVPTLINKDVFEPSYNDLKFAV